MTRKATTSETPPIGLQHLVYDLAPTVLSVDDLAARIGLPQEAIDTYVNGRGLKQVHFAESESVSDIALRVARRALEESQTDPLEVDALIIYHSLYNVPLAPKSVAAMIQHELGLSRAIGLSISQQNCASINMAIRVARNMIIVGSARTVMIVGADSVQDSRGREIKQIGLLSDGGGALLVKQGCSVNRLIAISNLVKGGFYAYLNWGREDLEKYNTAYFVATARIIDQTVRRAGLSLDDIHLIIPHNINISSWRRLLAMLEIDESRFFGDNIARHSHSFGTDIIINLHDAIQTGRLGKGDLALLVTAGLGACWGCVLIEH